MAKELNIVTGITGQTVVSTPYLLGVAQAPIAMTEYDTTGAYWGDMIGAKGVYEIVFSVSGTTVGAGQIVWDGTEEITGTTDNIIEGTLSLGDAIKLILAATAGSSAGAGTGTFEYKSVDGITTRIRSTFDANNNRQITLLDAT